MKKKIIIVLAIGATLFLCYRLFEPVFVYNLDRKPLELTNYDPQIIHNEDYQITADSILMNSFERLVTPAISAAVNINGDKVWANAIGYSDLDKGVKIKTSTLFRTGSTSKAITSIGLGVLLESDKLTLDTKLRSQLDFSNEINGDLTLKQLASHTSGIRNYSACFCFPIWEALNTKKFETIEAAVSVFEDDALLFEPGSSFSYSTYNFTLLSALMEASAKKPFTKFITQSVFDPLGIEHTVAEDEATSILDIATFYDVEDNQFGVAYPVNNSNKIAGGGFLSTPSDLVALGNVMVDNSLFSEETTEKLITPVALNNGEVNEQNYALGWRNDITEKMFNGDREVQIIHHGGTANGSTSFLVVFPEYKMSISILINRSSQSFGLSEHVYKLAEHFILNIEKEEFKNDKTHSQNVQSVR